MVQLRAFLCMFCWHLENQNFLYLFAITAAGAVPCGGPKKSPTLSIVQIMFYFWSFEIKN